MHTTGLEHFSKMISNVFFKIISNVLFFKLLNDFVRMYIVDVVCFTSKVFFNYLFQCIACYFRCIYFLFVKIKLLYLQNNVLMFFSLTFTCNKNLKTTFAAMLDL